MANDRRTPYRRGGRDSDAFSSALVGAIWLVIGAVSLTAAYFQSVWPCVIACVAWHAVCRVKLWFDDR